MAKLLIDEIHVGVYVSTKLPRIEGDAIAKILQGKRLQSDLKCAIRTLFRRYRGLRRCTINLNR
jgi:hypothetical protein